MNKTLAMGLGIALQFELMEQEQCAEFSKRKEEARQKYWDACKYPRKTKKRMRKKARADFELYSILEQPVKFF